MTDKLSVVTPSFNQGLFIERTISSVLNQDLADLEYVVFDGGSRDATVEILRQYEGRLSWTSEEDRGQAHAVNKGIKATRGEVIGWLNSDDIYYPGALQAVCDFLKTHPEVDVVYGNAYHIDENDQVLEPYPTEQWDFQRLQDVCFICQPAAFFRRETVERFGMLDERLQYCMDYEFWLRLGAKGARFAHLPKPLAGSRLYRETKTLGARMKVHREINSMMRKTFGHVPDKWIFNYAHAYLDAKNFNREDRPRFVMAVSILSVLASIYWNRRIPHSLWQTATGWMRSAFNA